MFGASEESIPDRLLDRPGYNRSWKAYNEVVADDPSCFYSASAAALLDRRPMMVTVRETIGA
jgi:hypothetical protein